MTIEAVIRDEVPQDAASIRRVICDAGGGNPQDPAADLVEQLRARGKSALSLVATVDDEIVGHIMFSAMSVDRCPTPSRAVGLAPLMVSTRLHRRGIGSQLMHAGLDRCRGLGFDIAVVLGSHNYYPRFGFQRASNYGLGNEYDADEHFMVTELRPGTLASYSGVARFAPEFKELGC